MDSASGLSASTTNAQQRTAMNIMGAASLLRRASRVAPKGHYGGAADGSVRFDLRRDADFLYLAVDVTDDVLDPDLMPRVQDNVHIILDAAGGVQPAPPAGRGRTHPSRRRSSGAFSRRDSSAGSPRRTPPSTRVRRRNRRSSRRTSRSWRGASRRGGSPWKWRFRHLSSTKPREATGRHSTFTWA